MDEIVLKEVAKAEGIFDKSGNLCGKLKLHK